MECPNFSKQRRVRFREGALFNKLRLARRAYGVLVSYQGTSRVVDRMNARCAWVNLATTVRWRKIICSVLFIVLLRCLLHLFSVIFRRACFPMFYRRLQDARLRAIRVGPSEALCASSSKLLRAPPILGEVASRDVKEGNNGNVIPIACLCNVRNCFGRHSINSVLQRLGPISRLRRVINEGLGTQGRTRGAIFRCRRRSDNEDSRANGRRRQQFVGRGASSGGAAGGRGGSLGHLWRSFREAITGLLALTMCVVGYERGYASGLWGSYGSVGRTGAWCGDRRTNVKCNGQ